MSWPTNHRLCQYAFRVIMPAVSARRLNGRQFLRETNYSRIYAVFMSFCSEYDEIADTCFGFWLKLRVNGGNHACLGWNEMYDTGNNRKVTSVVVVGWLCWGLTSQSTIFQSCRDGAIASWVINQYFRGVKCLAQGHNTAEVGLETLW